MLKLKNAIIVSIIASSILRVPHALSMDIVPPIESFNFVSDSVPSKYKEATRNAERAFIIQSGVKSNFDAIRNTINKKATADIENKIVNNISPIIDAVLPVKKEYLITAAGGAYSFLIDKKFSKSFRNPIYRNVRHFVRWSPVSLETGMTISF